MVLKMDESKEDQINQAISLGSEELSMRGTILNHIKEINVLSRQELTKGYFEEKLIKVGDGISTSKIYHPDLRIAFINSVDMLFYLVSPHNDEKFNEIVKDFKEFDGEKKEKVNEELSTKRKLFANILIFLHRIKFFNVERHVN